MNVNRDITGVSPLIVLCSRMAIRRGELNSQRNQAPVGILIVAIKPNYADNRRHNEPLGADRSYSSV